MNIRKYEDKDYERIRQLALSSFCLDSFHTDPFFSKEEADRIIWEIWTMPALDPERNRCFVAEHEGIVTGFLLFGGMKELGQIYGRKIGTIIILAVDEKYRKSPKKFGTSLVRFMTGFFQKADVGIITVGTDTANVPALKCYSSCGFQPVLYWSTYRHYAQHLIPLEGNLKVLENNRPESLMVEKYFQRPVSFLNDPNLAEDFRIKVRSHYTAGILEGIGSSGLLSLEICESGSTLGYAVFQEEEAISRISGKKIWRLNDLLAGPQNRETCLKHALKYIVEEKGAKLVECFCETGRKDMISDLEAVGFAKTHDAVTLHFQFKD
jgi:ribosomal protein S18 acetylase RimI-like enzyme